LILSFFDDAFHCSGYIVPNGETTSLGLSLFVEIYLHRLWPPNTGGKSVGITKLKEYIKMTSLLMLP
jgi:hypothetical protein